jgi:hypothetical protein
MKIYDFDTDDSKGYLYPKCPHKSDIMVGKSKPSIGSYACVAFCAYCRGFRYDGAFWDNKRDPSLRNKQVRCCADEEAPT